MPKYTVGTGSATTANANATQSPPPFFAGLRNRYAALQADLDKMSESSQDLTATQKRYKKRLDSLEDYIRRTERGFTSAQRESFKGVFEAGWKDKIGRLKQVGKAVEELVKTQTAVETSLTRLGRAKGGKANAQALQELNAAVDKASTSLSKSLGRGSGLFKDDLEGLGKTLTDSMQSVMGKARQEIAKSVLERKAPSAITLPPDFGKKGIIKGVGFGKQTEDQLKQVKVTKTGGIEFEKTIEEQWKQFKLAKAGDVEFEKTVEKQWKQFKLTNEEMAKLGPKTRDKIIELTDKEAHPGRMYAGKFRMEPGPSKMEKLAAELTGHPHSVTGWTLGDIEEDEKKILALKGRERASLYGHEGPKEEGGLGAIEKTVAAGFMGGPIAAVAVGTYEMAKKTYEGWKSANAAIAYGLPALEDVAKAGRLTGMLTPEMQAYLGTSPTGGTMTINPALARMGYHDIGEAASAISAYGLPMNFQEAFEASTKLSQGKYAFQGPEEWQKFFARTTEIGMNVGGGEMRFRDQLQKTFDSSLTRVMAPKQVFENMESLLTRIADMGIVASNTDLLRMATMGASSALPGMRSGAAVGNAMQAFQNLTGNILGTPLGYTATLSELNRTTGTMTPGAKQWQKFLKAEGSDYVINPRLAAEIDKNKDKPWLVLRMLTDAGLDPSDFMSNIYGGAFKATGMKDWKGLAYTVMPHEAGPFLMHKYGWDPTVTPTPVTGGMTLSVPGAPMAPPYGGLIDKEMRDKLAGFDVDEAGLSAARGVVAGEASLYLEGSNIALKTFGDRLDEVNRALVTFMTRIEGKSTYPARRSTPTPTAEPTPPGTPATYEPPAALLP